MASEEPEKGDQVSWQHGSSHPSGEVVEKKAEGELSIQSKRGNTITKKAEPEDPAVHIARPGNDVVKNQSELTVEEKANGAGNAEDEVVNEADAANEDAPASKTGEKRKADADEGEPKKKARGRPKRADAPAVKKAPAAKKGAKAAEKKEDKPEEKTEEPAKKARGRPKKEGAAEKTPTKTKKTKTATKSNGTGVGSRTRSKN